MAIPTYATEGSVANAVIAPNLGQYARGMGVTFEVDFFEDAPTNTVVAVPSNPSAYPAFAIVDPSGVTVSTGVGTAGSAPGRWQTTYNIPSTAPLSTQTNKWRVVWNMLTGTARQLQQTVPFDVIELRTPNTLEDLRSHAYLVYAGNPETLVLRLPFRPQTLSVQAFSAQSLTSPVPNSTASFSGSLAASTVTEIQEQNLYSYIFETPALTGYGEYQIVWNYKATLTSPSETVVQKLFVPPPVFWSLAPSLKTLIDKLQKKYGTIQSYPDADLYEYFLRGLGMLNGVTPVTNWSLVTFPYASMTTRFLIEGAALWAIKAQHMVAVELAFSFSGQLVTLDVDHTSGYSEIIDKLTDDLFGDGKGSFPATKVGLMRSINPIAHVGNRLMGRYTYNQYTYKVDTGYIGSGSSTLFDGRFPGSGVNVGFTLTDVLIYLNLV